MVRPPWPIRTRRDNASALGDYRPCRYGACHALQPRPSFCSETRRVGARDRSTAQERCRCVETKAAAPRRKRIAALGLRPHGRFSALLAPHPAQDGLQRHPAAVLARQVPGEPTSPARDNQAPFAEVADRAREQGRTGRKDRHTFENIIGTLFSRVGVPPWTGYGPGAILRTPGAVCARAGPARRRATVSVACTMVRMGFLLLSVVP